MELLSKLENLMPSKLYETLDVFSRDALFYVANDLGWGMGISIAVLSLAIKGIFLPLMI